MSVEAMALTPNIIKESSGGYEAVRIEDELFLSREIFLCGSVDSDSMEAVIKQLIYLYRADPGKEITFYINSPGGEVRSGICRSPTATARIPRLPPGRNKSLPRAIPGEAVFRLTVFSKCCNFAVTANHRVIWNFVSVHSSIKERLEIRMLFSITSCVSTLFLNTVAGPYASM